jgi:hypothetical protein
MEYKGFKGLKYRELLAKGKCYEYNYYIFNFGTHPCCYVEIPYNHKLFKTRKIIELIKVHGGITFNADHLNGIDETGTSHFIGWDYAHSGAGDYCYYGDGFEIGEHKWTTEEMQEDIKNVCKQLQELG